AAGARRAASGPPEDVRHDLGGIKTEAPDLPDINDLTAEKPPLSPTILGLFRGLPLDYTDHVVPSPAGRAGKGRAQPGSAGGGAGPGGGGRSAAPPAGRPPGHARRRATVPPSPQPPRPPPGAPPPRPAGPPAP